MMTTSAWACGIVVLVAVSNDIFTRRIPNVVTLCGVFVGDAIHGASRFVDIGAVLGPVLGFDVEARAFAFSLLVLFPYRLVRHRAFGIAIRNLRIGLLNVFRSREPYVTGPKHPPVILAQAIGIAFALTLLQNGALR